jgi:MFS family permease
VTGVASDEGGVWTPGRRMLTTGLILLVTLVASEALAVAVVMPRVERSLGDLGLYGWVFSAFFLGQLVGIVVAGRACDRVRPLLPFSAGLILFVAGLLIGGSAGSMPVLVAARALQGLGAGALPAVAYVCIGREYPAPSRPRMFALLSTAWVVPSLVGPAAAAVVGEHFGWRWVFLGLVPVVLVCGAVVITGVARIATPDGDGAEGSNLRDALVVALGAGLALAGLDQARLVGAVPLCAVGLALCLGAFRRLTPPGTLRARPGLPATVLVRGVLTFSFFMADAYVTYLLTTERGASAIVAPAALTASSVLWTLGSWIQERRVGVDGPRPLVAVGFVFVGAGIGLLMATVSGSVPAALGVVAWGIGGLGIGMAYSPLSVTALAEAEAGQEGRATSALQLSDVLGVALGTGLGGVIIAHGAQGGKAGGPALVAVFAVALAVSVVGVVLSRRLPRHLEAESAPEPVRSAPPSASPSLSVGHLDQIIAGAAPQPVPAVEAPSQNPHS